MIGGDGKKYLREGHAVFLPGNPPLRAADGPGKLNWTYQNSTVFLPFESGVSGHRECLAALRQSIR